MIALIQRVSQASVVVDDKTIAAIGRGILALIGIQSGDSEKQADRLLQRILSYRIFPDQAGKMNLDMAQAGGSLLLVPQFTLAADTNRGNRPSFTPAAPPDEGQRLFRYLVMLAGREPGGAQAGEFGADMKVQLVNDGPVTFWLQVPPTA